MAYLRGILRYCSRHLDLTLEGGCGSECSRLPPVCMQHDAVYTVLHYLADVQFMTQQQVSSTSWSVEKYSSI